jgi:large subunit ribosomal protein L46
MLRALRDRALRVAASGAVPRGAASAAAERRWGAAIALAPADATPAPASRLALASARAAPSCARGKRNAKATRPDPSAPPAARPLVANMILERLPVVMPALESWEEEYLAWSRERAQSFRKRLPEALVDPKGEFDATEDTESARDETEFVPAPRTTPADVGGDVRTRARKLDEFLFLVVQDAKSGEWGFPRLVNDESGAQTMRQCAEEAMRGAVGDAVETYVVGNAPLGHWRIPRAPEDDGGGAAGGTHFYHRAQWLEGELELNREKYKDFKWLTKVRQPRRDEARREARREGPPPPRILILFLPPRSAERSSERVFVRFSGRLVPPPSSPRCPHARSRRERSEMTNHARSITGLLSTDAHLTALSDTSRASGRDPTFVCALLFFVSRGSRPNGPPPVRELTIPRPTRAGGARGTLRRGAPRVPQGHMLTRGSARFEVRVPGAIDSPFISSY